MFTYLFSNQSVPRQISNLACTLHSKMNAFQLSFRKEMLDFFSFTIHEPSYWLHPPSPLFFQEKIACFFFVKKKLLITKLTFKRIFFFKWCFYHSFIGSCQKIQVCFQMFSLTFCVELSAVFWDWIKTHM